ncbi:hypothetical protein ABXV22_07785 [Vibrio rotiferianus]|uniref:Flagellar basal-body/hook protein C-terminal domain-containing protein n=1 Tax=Vibrio rotiferianus TaxID=190895 RepID=A0A7Y4E0T2_9VIBR|nr:hypothetical protein [Vibrio rotiferianus]NOH47380.1 hypothetical protein [Vibrio rotiferianus]
MPVSGISTGNQMIQLSQKMAEKAVQEIQQPELALDHTLSFNKVESLNTLIDTTLPPPSNDAIDPLVSLIQASTYNRIGASVVEKNNEVIGSLLDIHV